MSNTCRAFDVKEVQIEGRIRFTESFFVKRYEGTDWEETIEVTGLRFSFDDPRFCDANDEDRQGSHYYTIDPRGYALTKKGERRKDNRYPNAVWMDHEDQKRFARRILSTLGIEGFIWPDEVLDVDPGVGHD